MANSLAPLWQSIVNTFYHVICCTITDTWLCLETSCTAFKRVATTTLQLAAATCILCCTPNAFCREFCYWTPVCGCILACHYQISNQEEMCSFNLWEEPSGCRIPQKIALTYCSTLSSLPLRNCVVESNYVRNGLIFSVARSANFRLNGKEIRACS